MKKWLGGWSPSRRTGRITAGLLLGTTLTVLVLARVYDLGVPATIVAVLIGLPALWLAWVPYRSEQRKTVREVNLHDLSDQLAKTVRRQWEAEAKIRRLNDPYPLSVSWSAADPALTDDWAVIKALASGGAGRPGMADQSTWAEGAAELTGKDDALAAVLALVPTHRLVVLGEPGAGKTMLMVRLVLDLLASRHAGMPVPFLVPIASWNPVSQGLHEWLAGRLTVNHSALTEAFGDGTQAQALLEAGLILPLLDGLDEIPHTIRGSAIAQINDALRPGEAMIITCRTEDYRRAVRPSDGPEVTLRAAAGIQLSPLSPDVIGSYLLTDAGGPMARERWMPVIEALGSAAPVAQALTTPLMVSLARLIYNPRPGETTRQLSNPAELCGADLPDKAAVETFLLDAFVPAAYRDVKGDQHVMHRTERWLRFLAAYLDSGIGGTDIAWWQIRQITPFAINIDIGQAARKPIRIQAPAQRLSIEWRGFRSIIFGAFVGAFFGWLMSANSAPPKNTSLWLPSSTRDCIGGAIIGMVVFVAWNILEGVPGSINTAASPRAILHSDQKTFWSLSLFVTISVGLSIGLGGEVVFGYKYVLLFWLGGFALGAFLAAWTSTASATWYVYKSAHIWLVSRHQLPWRLMTFLEDSHRRGVLRQAGAVYQFRHNELQHRLADRYEEPVWFHYRAKFAFLSSVMIALSADTPVGRQAAELNHVIVAAQARSNNGISDNTPSLRLGGR